MKYGRFVNVNNWNPAEGPAATDPFKEDKDGVEESSMKEAGLGGFGYEGGAVVGMPGTTMDDIQEIGTSDKVNKEEAEGHHNGD